MTSAIEDTTPGRDASSVNATLTAVAKESAPPTPTDGASANPDSTDLYVTNADPDTSDSLGVKNVTASPVTALVTTTATMAMVSALANSDSADGDAKSVEMDSSSSLTAGNVTVTLARPNLESATLNQDPVRARIDTQVPTVTSARLDTGTTHNALRAHAPLSDQTRLSAIKTQEGALANPTTTVPNAIDVP